MHWQRRALLLPESWLHVLTAALYSETGMNKRKLILSTVAPLSKSARDTRSTEVTDDGAVFSVFTLA